MRPPSHRSYRLRMPVYLVERYAAGIDANELGERLGAATAALRAEGADVAWLLSIVLPSEDGCLCLFEASSPAEVVRANRRASAPYDRLVETVELAGGLGDLSWGNLPVPPDPFPWSASRTRG